MQVRRRCSAGLVGLATAVMAVLAVVAPASPALAAGPGVRAAAVAPYVSGTETVPTYSYATAVHQSVYVETPLDSDNNGVADRVALDIVRPATPDGVTVPLILDASPYYSCCGRGNESEKKTYGSDGTIAKMPLWFDNYFVPRGYAVAGVDLVGTSRSTGCSDVGGPSEVAGAKAVIDWLNGRVNAYDKITGGLPVAASSWSNGKVGMIGKSWDGSIANGVAATGVDGLKTIVPISAISSWYDYARYNGVRRTSGYVSYLANYVNGRGSTCSTSIIPALQTASDDTTGNYNSFWQARDYRVNASKVKASVFLVHGLNDLNVTTAQVGNWWPQLAANNVPRKTWLSQDGHVDPFDIRRDLWVDTLHRWFDYWLQDLPNGIMSEPQASVQRVDGTWQDESVWPAPTTATTLPLASYGGTTTRKLTDAKLSESSAVANPDSAVTGRAAFVSKALANPVRMSGNASVTLKVRVTAKAANGRATTSLTTRLVDYGSQRRVDYGTGEGATTGTTESCYGESTAVDDGCYKNVTQNFTTASTSVYARGYLDAEHYQSLTTRATLALNTWYTMTVPVNAQDAVFPSGHRLGLVVTLSDPGTAPTTSGAQVDIDPSGSSMTLPISGGTIPAAATKVSSARLSQPAPSSEQQQRILVP